MNQIEDEPDVSTVCVPPPAQMIWPMEMQASFAASSVTLTVLGTV
jgi:hypothetical protein